MSKEKIKELKTNIFLLRMSNFLIGVCSVIIYTGTIIYLKINSETFRSMGYALANNSIANAIFGNIYIDILFILCGLLFGIYVSMRFKREIIKMFREKKE